MAEEADKLEDKPRENSYRKILGKLKKFIEENDEDSIIKIAQQIEVIIKEVRGYPKMGKGKSAVFDK